MQDKIQGYRADEIARTLINRAPERILQKEKWIVFLPEQENNAKIGLIFYPGCQVEVEAYAPLLDKVSRQGITCVAIRMPLEHAINQINAADEVYSHFPDISDWYMCGHSLGGAMALRYSASRINKMKGVIVLGAYLTKTLLIPTLAIYGTKDMVLKQNRFEAMQNGVAISGGNHAYFGNYGEQKGDGIASITCEQQQDITVSEIIKFILAPKWTLIK